MESDSTDHYENENIKRKSDMELDTVSSSVPEKRKSLKPIMEKRRRARINASLEELKSFLIDVIKKEGLRHNKMEKADILELTVKQLRQLRQKGLSCDSTAESDTFLQGFSECLNIVNGFLQKNPGLDPTVQIRLLEHLSLCMNRNSLKSFESFKDKNESHTVKPAATVVSQNGQFLLREKEGTQLKEQPTLFLNQAIENSNSTQGNTGNINSCEISNHGQRTACVRNSTLEIINPNGFSQNSSNKNKSSINSVIPFYMSEIQQQKYVENLNIVPNNEPVTSIAYLIPLNVIPSVTNVVSSTCVPRYLLTVPSSADGTQQIGEMNTDSIKNCETSDNQKLISIDKSRVIQRYGNADSDEVNQMSSVSEKDSLNKSSFRSKTTPLSADTSPDLSQTSSTKFKCDTSGNMPFLSSTAVMASTSSVSLNYQFPSFSTDNFQRNSKHASNYTESSPTGSCNSASLTINHYTQGSGQAGNSDRPEVNQRHVWRPW